MNKKTILAILGVLLCIGMTSQSMASSVWGYFRPVWDADGKLSGPIFTIPAISPDGDLNKSFLIDTYSKIVKFTRHGWEDYYLGFTQPDHVDIKYNLIDEHTKKNVSVPDETLDIFGTTGSQLIFHSNGLVYGFAWFPPSTTLSQTAPEYNNYKIIQANSPNSAVRYYTERKDSHGVTMRFDSFGRVIGIQSGNFTGKFFISKKFVDENNNEYLIADENGNDVTNMNGSTYRNDEGLIVNVNGSIAKIIQPEDYFFKLSAIDPVNAEYEKTYKIMSRALLDSTIGHVEAKVMFFTQESNHPESRFILDPSSIVTLDAGDCDLNGFVVLDDSLFLFMSDAFRSDYEFSATYTIPASGSYLPCVLDTVTIKQKTT